MPRFDGGFRLVRRYWSRLVGATKLDVGLQFFQVSQFIVDFLLLRCQLFLLLLKVFDDLLVGSIDIAGVTQEAGFLTRLGIFQEQGNGVGLAVL